LLATAFVNANLKLTSRQQVSSKQLVVVVESLLNNVISNCKGFRIYDGDYVSVLDDELRLYIRNVLL